MQTASAPPESALGLPRSHVLWLAAAIACAQFPLLPHLPVWAGIVGLALIVARVTLAYWDRPPPPAWTLALVSIVGIVAIRLHFGYFAGREPCVALLFLLVSLKLLEAKQARDATSLRFPGSSCATRRHSST